MMFDIGSRHYKAILKNGKFGSSAVESQADVKKEVAFYLGAWQMWYMRVTENHVNLVRFRELPQDLEYARFCYREVKQEDSKPLRR